MELGPAEICAGQISTGKIRMTQVCTPQVGTLKIGIPEICALDICALEWCIAEILAEPLWSPSTMRSTPLPLASEFRDVQDSPLPRDLACFRDTTDDLTGVPNERR